MNLVIGESYKVGGPLGPVMTLESITENGTYILVSDSGRGTFFYHIGDCTLVKVPKPKLFEQLTLF